MQSFSFINIGVVKKLLREFENQVFQDKKVGKRFMDDYLKKVGSFLSIIDQKDGIF